MTEDLRAVEQALFLQYSTESPEGAPCVFILGSPRTGSTPFYQVLCHGFSLTYFSNLINRKFASYPLVGALIQDELENEVSPLFESSYGKIEGVLQPSEASYVFKNWFGGGHPSQLKASEFLPGKRSHMRRTLSGIVDLTGQPIIMKNAWNCFRVEALADAFPNAFFIWIRRDLRDSAASDLEARYTVQGDPEVWNSATPANYAKLRSRPYWEQVVENQYEFNTTVKNDLEQHASKRSASVWYEDLCDDSVKTMENLQDALNRSMGTRLVLEEQVVPDLTRSRPSLNEDDMERIEEYLNDSDGRHSAFRYESDTARSSLAWSKIQGTGEDR